MRNWRARSIWSVRETLGSDSEWIRSSTIRRSAAGCLAASSFLSERASARASARRGVSGNARKEGVDRRQRSCGVVDGGQRQGLGLHGLPALVMANLFLGGFDLPDRGGQLRRLVLELSEPGTQIGRGRAVGDLDVGRLDLPFGLFLRASRARAGQNVGSEECRSSSSDQRRATAGAALSPARSNDDAR